jgi:hypothetical protein
VTAASLQAVNETYRAVQFTQRSAAVLGAHTMTVTIAAVVAGASSRTRMFVPIGSPAGLAERSEIAGNARRAARTVCCLCKSIVARASTSPLSAVVTCPLPAARSVREGSHAWASQGTRRAVEPCRTLPTLRPAPETANGIGRKTCAARAVHSVDAHAVGGAAAVRFRGGGAEAKAVGSVVRRGAVLAP